MEIGKKVKQPWGYEIWLAHNEHYIMRFLHLDAGAAVSLQYHKQKVETLYILKGKAEYYLQKPNEEMQVTVIGPGTILNHKPYEIHRQVALEDFEFVEVSTPQIDDIVRLEDKYGRAKKED